MSYILSNNLFSFPGFSGDYKCLDIDPVKDIPHGIKSEVLKYDTIIGFHFNTH